MPNYADTLRQLGKMCPYPDPDPYAKPTYAKPTYAAPIYPQSRQKNNNEQMLLKQKHEREQLELKQKHERELADPKSTRSIINTIEQPYYYINNNIDVKYPVYKIN